MSKNQPAPSRIGIGPRNPLQTSASPVHLADGGPTTPHPLSILAIASGVRLDDPRLEQERVVMLEVAIIAGREAAHALDKWLSQSLAEYRGSRSAWDLETTTDELRVRLDHYDRTLHETADRLMSLIPHLADRQSESVPATPSKRSGRRVLDEVAAASGLFAALDSRTGNCSDPTRFEALMERPRCDGDRSRGERVASRSERDANAALGMDAP
jgi:hypothetical protein